MIIKSRNQPIRYQLALTQQPLRLQWTLLIQQGSHWLQRQIQLGHSNLSDLQTKKENLALLWPKYNIDLDAENKAHGGNTDHFDLAFLTQSGTTPNIRGVEVEVSTDDGKTWGKTKAESREDGHYKVWVKNPNSGIVSLHIKAWDDKGSQIEQTLIKAYSVR
ncbi:hypothetical protein [Gottfriedia acidiceleris]|uniref:hypothetical protein n=1 Tax=Gottfriedia acidiceleris TaxID=371036 RepID=UPI0030009E3D